MTGWPDPSPPLGYSTVHVLESSRRRVKKVQIAEKLCADVAVMNNRDKSGVIKVVYSGIAGVGDYRVLCSM